MKRQTTPWKYLQINISYKTPDQNMQYNIKNAQN